MISKHTSNREIDNKASALASTRAGKHSNHIAEEVAVAALIKDLPLTAHKRQSILPGVGASLLDKFQLLEHVKPQERLSFFQGVLARALAGSRGIDFLCAVLTRAGYALEPEERQSLLQRLSGEKNRQSAVSRCWLALARSATSLAEALRIIDQCGRDRLMGYRNRELREFVATVELLSVLRSLERPKPLSIHTLHPAALERAKKQLEGAYVRAHDLLRIQKSWAGRSQKYSMLSSMLKLSAKAFVRDYAEANTSSQRNEVLRTTYARFATEIRYGKAFTEASPADQTEKKARWRIEELHTVVRAIKSIGEFQISIASGICEFKRKADLGDSLADHESPSGILWFSDSAFSESHRDGRLYRKGRTPQEVVVHELAHGLSLSDYSRLDWQVGKGTFTLLDFLRADHFPEVFLNLGRWYSTSSGFRIDTDTDLVFLRDGAGKEHAITLGVPVYTETDKEARKEARVYNYLPDYHLLIWHEPRKAEFTDRAYGREDPTEMLAELYGAYFGDRKTVFRLIQNAPNLFWYMESLHHKYRADEAVWSSLRARLSSKRESGTISRVLEREGSDQSLFRMLTDQEQLEVISKLGAPVEASAELQESRAARLKYLNGFAKRDSMAQPLQDALQPVLAQYNQGILLARTVLAGGGDVAIASIRGSTESDDLSQLPMYDQLHKAVGCRLDEKRVFFLDDFHRSKRLGASTFLKKFETVIAEQLSGLSSRAPGQVKSLPKMYDTVVVYTGIPVVAEHLRAYARRKGIKNSLKVVEVSALSSSDLAKRLLRKNQIYEANTLHFFTLEETLLDLRAQFRVVMKESRTVLATIPLRRFLNKPDPRGWLDEVSERTGIPKRLLEIDKSDFTSRAALRLQLDEGASQNKMLKAFAKD